MKTFEDVARELNRNVYYLRPVEIRVYHYRDRTIQDKKPIERYVGTWNGTIYESSEYRKEWDTLYLFIWAATGQVRFRLPIEELFDLDFDIIGKNSETEEAILKIDLYVA